VKRILPDWLCLPPPPGTPMTISICFIVN
jgi:hypothetical protein